MAATPAEAVSIAEENKAVVRNNWEKIYPEILYEGTLAKIDHHPQLRELLVTTGIFNSFSSFCLIFILISNFAVLIFQKS